MKYKIIINEIKESEFPEMKYERLNEGEEPAKYGYVKTGQTEIKRTEQEIYHQELEDLDVNEIARFINQE